MNLRLAILAALGAALFASPVAQAATFGITGDAATAAAAAATAGGHTAVQLGNALTPTNLAGIDVLWALNSSNGSPLSALGTNAAAIDSFVAGGGVLMYHDRQVSSAASVLPGASFPSVRDASSGPADNLTVLPGAGVLANGPGGVINDTTLDGGNRSSHGYVLDTNLPVGATALLSRGATNQIVDFVYPYGAGFVYYSTIPLDFYLSGSGIQPAFVGVYAPNVVAFAAGVPEPSALVIASLAAVPAVGLRRRVAG